MEKISNEEKFGAKEVFFYLTLLLALAFDSGETLASIPKNVRVYEHPQIAEGVQAEILKIKTHILALKLRGEVASNYAKHKLPQPSVEDFSSKSKQELRLMLISFAPELSLSDAGEDLDAFLDNQKKSFLKEFFQEALQSGFDFSHLSLEEAVRIAQEVLSADPASGLLKSLYDALWQQIKTYAENEEEMDLYLIDRLNALEKLRVEKAYPFLKIYFLIQALTNK